VIPWHPGFLSTSSYPLWLCEAVFINCAPAVHDKQHPPRQIALNMRLSTVVTGLLFGLEAAALKPVPRTVPEIEKAVCIRSRVSVVRVEERDENLDGVGASDVSVVGEGENARFTVHDRQ
jgi:hypothetical protein